MSETADDDDDDGSGHDERRDVVVVGGGPAGCSAGVFTARYGLDTLVFDRGNAALQRCAFVENYPGFPGGVDVPTLLDLFRDHAAAAGCDRIEDTVESVERPADDESGFVVETQDGRRVRASYVLAAAWYDGSYLRPVVGDDAFEVHDHHGETHERFDHEYADVDGRTPADGLYVASPGGERSAQVVIAAGNGAHVARSLLEDHKRERGFPEGVAPHYDWKRPESEFSGEWGDRDRWREWFEAEAGDDHGLDDDRFAELREAYIDRAFDTKLTDEEIARQTEAGYHRLLDHVDDEYIESYLDDRRE
ncbi:NAD(P)/FAD-dependent oxidoreductase [Halobacterium rubrum]|uniref:NAD(P)/FAD-dependent oxidoreductase n=1 Tax=Halobacterium TaxID=2239 RepID=UPI001F435416|nr:NAD(P)/FAD-dependent oxidoreductase [Halobacterium rubrum]MDH5018859.1 NAD(P)/FAD-dependent oxidoreductase [Halobacterium rubrum]